MVRYGAQGESTVQYCGTIVVHGTVHMVRLLRFCTVGTVHGTLGALVGRVQLLT